MRASTPAGRRGSPRRRPNLNITTPEQRVIQIVRGRRNHFLVQRQKQSRREPAGTAAIDTPHALRQQTLRVKLGTAKPRKRTTKMLQQTSPHHPPIAGRETHARKKKWVAHSLGSIIRHSSGGKIGRRPQRISSRRPSVHDERGVNDASSVHAGSKITSGRRRQHPLKFSRRYGIFQVMPEINKIRLEIDQSVNSGIGVSRDPARIWKGSSTARRGPR